MFVAYAKFHRLPLPARIPQPLRFGSYRLLAYRFTPRTGRRGRPRAVWAFRPGDIFSLSLF